MSRSYLKNLISFEALVPFAIIVVLVLLILRLLASKTPGYKPQRKKYYFYLFINILVVSIVVAILYNLKQTGVVLRHFSLLFFSLILGGLHVFFFRWSFKKFDTENKFKEILFAMITGFVLVVPIIMISAFFNDLAYLPYYFLTVAAFLLPTCFFILYLYSVSIPVKLYYKWYYPLEKKYETPYHYELKNMIVLNFMFHKNAKESHVTSFKAKAPKDMNYGRLFFFFINDYNVKKTTTKIELTEDSGDPYGWYFYTKPKWYGASRHIDSELTVEQNNLKDGDIVVCQRI
ncbi:TssN family type VI secretion system protein [Spongiimicrobium salis]|uniref:TssN family type VI secretion system protein n=1 Tax=Spongiimicrobium salis TaxID=1667022 RepID=UPI00374D3067